MSISNWALYAIVLKTRKRPLELSVGLGMLASDYLFITGGAELESTVTTLLKHFPEHRYLKNGKKLTRTELSCLISILETTR